MLSPKFLGSAKPWGRNPMQSISGWEMRELLRLCTRTTTRTFTAWFAATRTSYSTPPPTSPGSPTDSSPAPPTARHPQAPMTSYPLRTALQCLGSALTLCARIWSLTLSIGMRLPSRVEWGRGMPSTSPLCGSTTSGRVTDAWRLIIGMIWSMTSGITISSCCRI
ncbi:UNVERIFIED_CONTAM: hypothetical protein GTU68_031332 [Idotea baltica]|nr:hypothetical protein [Idotea baltica]